MTNQREMMEKISALDFKLEKLQSDDQSSQSTLMELLIKVNERLDQLDKNSSHTCCGGPVILQTTRHANVVHQPILDPCFSCRDAKRIHRIESSSTAPSKDHTLTKERDDQIFSPPLNAASIRTSHVCSMESDTSKSISGKQPRVDLVSVTQNEPLPEPQILHVATCNRTSSPRVTSSFHSMPPIDASPLLKNKQDNSMRKLPWVPENGVNTSVLSSKQTLPVTGEHFPKDDACIFVFKESGPSPNRSRSESQSLVATTTSTTSVVTDVSTVPRQQRVSSPQTEHSKLSSPSLTKHLTMPSTQGVSPVQVMLAPSSQPSHTDRHMGLIDGHAGGKEPSLHVTEIQPDHQSTATVSPVTLSTITKNTATCYYPVAGASSQPSHSIPQQAIVVVNSSTCSTPSLNSSDQHSSRVQVPSLSPSSAQKNIPPGYISLSHTLDVQPSPCTVNNTKAWQPQTVLTTSASHSMQQGTEFHGSSATRAILQRSGKYNACMCTHVPGGVLRYISDRGVRSPFLGLKFAI